MQCFSCFSISTGWSSYFKSKDTTDSTQPLGVNQKACLAKKGLSSHAFCCRAPNLECHVITHGFSGLMEQVKHDANTEHCTL